MKTGVGVVGCGYVFDHYMATFRQHPSLELVGVTDIDRPRLETVSRAYEVPIYDDLAALLAEPSIRLVLNLTSIPAHYAVTKAALEAGKHVYSEKPFTSDLDQARELMALAGAKGVRLSGAPCNAMSNTVQTLWQQIEAGAVGKVRVVYAEFDDNPVYLMKPETWRSRTGAPWPYKHEFEAGCTMEHAGYYLSWLCAMFGPAEQVTAFSRCLAPDKTDEVLDPPDAPDFSVACITFASGVVARLTCSIVAPYDQRLRVIGDEGELSVDTYRDYNCPVRLERFSSLSLNARKARWVRGNTSLQRLFGIGGSRVPLVARGPGLRAWKSPLRAFKRMQLGAQDKCAGLAEMAEAILARRAPWLAPEFVLHVTELTLAMQRAGPGGVSRRLETSFTPLKPLAVSARPARTRAPPRPALLQRLADPILTRMHAH